MFTFELFHGFIRMIKNEFILLVKIIRINANDDEKVFYFRLQPAVLVLDCA